MSGRCSGEKFLHRGMYIRSVSDKVRLYRQIGMICEVLGIYRSYTQLVYNLKMRW